MKATNKELKWLAILAAICIIGVIFAYCSTAQAQQQKATVESTQPTEWLQLSDIGYYRIIKEDDTRIEIELNSPITEFGSAITPQTFAKAQKQVTDLGVKLIQQLMKTNNYAGYVASHRRLVLIKYRSESWDSLIKEFTKIYKGIK